MNDQTHTVNKRDPRCQDLLNPVHCLSLGFGSGLLKPAPGTWGTLAALLPWWLLAQLPLGAYILLVVLACFIGVYICGYTAKAMGTHDHSAIVWDEFVGVWIALFMLPITWHGVLIAVLLFRLFDIWKPWPIGYFDQYVKGGLGIMLDDIIAGVFACLGTQLLLALAF